MGARCDVTRACLLAAVLTLVGCGAGEGTVTRAAGGSSPPPTTEEAFALSRCDEVVRPAPVDPTLDAGGGADPPIEAINAYAERFPDTFAGIWLDNANGGVLTVAFTDEVDVRRRELETLFPDAGSIRVVPAERSLAALEAIQERISRSALIGEVVDGHGSLPDQQVVSVLLRVLDAASVRALAEVVGPEAAGAVCVEGRTPEELDPEGPQSGRGQGWRLLGEGPVGPVYVTLVATGPDSLDDLWGASGLAPGPPEVDFDREIVVLFAPAVSGSCPQIRLDGVVVDGGRRLVHADFAYPGRPAACTADANPHTFVVALDRATLPASPFTIQLGEAIVCPGCAGAVPGESVVVDLPAPPSEIAFQLVISNQSFHTDPVDIRVEIDGVVVVERDFAVEGQHNWLRFDLVLAPGSHTLVATTARGEARHEVGFDLPAPRWGVLDYWDDGSAPKQFTWQLLDHEPAFA